MLFRCPPLSMRRTAGHLSGRQADRQTGSKSAPSAPHMFWYWCYYLYVVSVKCIIITYNPILVQNLRPALHICFGIGVTTFMSCLLNASSSLTISICRMHHHHLQPLKLPRMSFTRLRNVIHYWTDDDTLVTFLTVQKFNALKSYIIQYDLTSYISSMK
jgi:hypothetical protein